MPRTDGPLTIIERWTFQQKREFRRDYESMPTLDMIVEKWGLTGKKQAYRIRDELQLQGFEFSRCWWMQRRLMVPRSVKYRELSEGYRKRLEEMGE